MTLSTALVVNHELMKLIVQPFQTKFQFQNVFGKSYIKCDSNEKWASPWYSIDNVTTIPCMTNTSLEVNVKYHATDNTL